MDLHGDGQNGGKEIYQVLTKRCKTYATQGPDFLHLEEDDDIFQFYFKSCKLKLCLLDEYLNWLKSEEPFFITYLGKLLVNKVSKMINRFVEQIVFKQLITSAMGRPIF